MAYKYHRLSLTSSEARIQVPWVKVTLKSKTGEYTFGIFTNTSKKGYEKDDKGFWLQQTYGVRYPNYIQSLTVTKINGQVNQYVLNINYPITQNDDPNFFEKIFGSVSQTRKIIFTYGDAATPSFVYKEEEAVITNIQQSFNLEGSSISYTIHAISGAALNTPACLSFPAGYGKPSTKIKEVFYAYNLKSVFTGMNEKNWNRLIAGDDAECAFDTKVNISALDYIMYLVSCMYPVSNSSKTDPKSIYILTIHDESSYDNYYTYNRNFGDVRGTDINEQAVEVPGPYFKVSKVSYNTEKSDAYELDIGYNSSTIVTSFSLENNENYSLYYDHQMELAPDQYKRQINNNGKFEDVYAPTVMSNNLEFIATPSDRTWWTKITQFPVNATVTVQGLLRPARLLTYIRLNVIFPGGHKHISSGLYIITKQIDTIDGRGYRTQLNMTKVAGALLDKEQPKALNSVNNDNKIVKNVDQKHKSSLYGLK